MSAHKPGIAESITDPGILTAGGTYRHGPRQIHFLTVTVSVEIIGPNLKINNVVKIKHTKNFEEK